MIRDGKQATCRYVRVVALCAVAVAVAGCSTDDAASELPPLPPGASEPFDLYLAQQSDFVVTAMHKLADSCLAEAGFPQERSDDEATEPEGSIFKKPLEPRSEKQARKYGFGQPIPAEPGKVINDDPAFQAAAKKCDEEAQQKLGGRRELEKILGPHGDLRNTLQHGLNRKSEGILDEHKQELSDCLSQNGYERADGGVLDLNEGWEQFGITLGDHGEEDHSPVDNKGTPKGEQKLPGKSAREYIPTEEESDFAVEFVRCGKQTGVFADIDEKWKAMQQEIVEDHAAEFAELNPKIEALAKKAAEVLGK